MNPVNRDPVRRLPYEVWVKFIRYYAHEQPEGALPLLAVSSSWQSHLLETQELWNTVYLDGGHDELCRTECFFHLSRGLPIELILDKESQAVGIVTKHSDRINSLVFYTRSPNKLYTSDDILRHAGGLDGHQYPDLSHISVEPPCQPFVSIPPNLINACPALIGIHGAYIAQETVSILPASTTNVGIFTSRALPEGLGDRLEIFRVRQLLSNTQEVGRSRCFTTPSSRLASFELDYEVSGDSNYALTSHFGDSSQYLFPLEGFTSTIHHGLKVLSIAIPWYEISRLFPVLSTSTALRELKLIVDPAMNPPEPRHIPPLTISDIGHVRKLSVYIRPGALGWIYLFAPNLRRFLKLFIDGNALGYLELHLEFFRDVYKTFDSEILGLLQMTTNLTKLHLIGTRLAGMEPMKISLSSLHTFVGTLSTVRYIEMPNLACLVDTASDSYLDSQTHHSIVKTLKSVTVQASLFRQWIAAHSRTQFADDIFPRLITLKLLRSETYLEPVITPNFSSLQSITFEDTVYISPKSGIMGRHFNHFILETLLSPAICPYLHTIRATVCPNWALATAMLHRRNSLKTVTPIRSLWLPGYPQISILSSLSRALDTPMEDGSASTDAMIRVARTIKLRWELDFFRRQACRSCIVSGFIACQPYRNGPTVQETSIDPAVFDLLCLDSGAAMASKSETFALNEWEIYLNETVIPNIPGDPYFTRTCDRHDLENLVHIGPHTLAGTTYDLF